MLLRTKIFALLGLFFLCGCDDGNNSPVVLDAGTFTVNAPAGWQMIGETGYDSNVGRIVGPHGTLYFDQGAFSPGLDHISENERTIYFRRIAINNVPAVLHKERTAIANNERGKVVLTAYIDERGGMRRNRLYAYDLSPWGEKLMLEIIKTHRFK